MYVLQIDNGIITEVYRYKWRGGKVSWFSKAILQCSVLILVVLQDLAPSVQFKKREQQP